MRTILKYVMPQWGGESVEHQIPMGFVVRHFSVQVDKIMLWAEVEEDNPKLPVKFTAYATGAGIPDGPTYVGTVQRGIYVWHIYSGEETRKPGEHEDDS